MKSTSRIAGAGFFAVDVVLNGDGAVLTTSLGGSAGNVLSILSAFGWQSMPFAVLGEDRPASKLEAGWNALGMDTRFVHRSTTCSTPVVFQHQLDSSGGRTHRYTFACPKCGHQTTPKHESNSGYFSSALQQKEAAADVFYFDRATIDNVELAEYFSQRDALVVFEPSLVSSDPDFFHRAVTIADIVKYADDRFDAIVGFESRAIPLEIQTMGSRGLRFRAPHATGGEWVKVDAFELPHVVDAAGSGDWCTVGIIRALSGVRRHALPGLSVERFREAMVYGQALAALNCLTVGAQGLLQRLAPDRFRDPAEVLSCVDARMGPGFVVGSAGLSSFELEADAIFSALAKGPSLSGDPFPCCTA